MSRGGHLGGARRGRDSSFLTCVGRRLRAASPSSSLARLGRPTRPWSRYRWSSSPGLSLTLVAAAVTSSRPPALARRARERSSWVAI